MTKWVVWLALCAVSADGQTVETIPFRAVLSSANEIPAVNLNAAGTATILAHVVRDAGGQVISGSVDFNVRYQFPGEVTVTAMHIHRGAANANGLVVIDSGLQRFTSSTGEGTASYQGQVPPDSGTALDALRGLLQTPDAYYVNMHTTANPSGVMRGQLQRAEMSVYMALLDAANELPPVTGVPAVGVGSFTVITSRDDFSRITSAEATFEVNYSGFPAGTNFTGLHIHRGWPTENGPVTINSALAGPVAAADSGSGTLRYQVEVPVSEQAALDTLTGLASNPAGYYMNLHTQANQLGVMRGQMRKTDRMSFPVTLLPANEVPAVTGLDAAGPGLFTAHTVRDNFGGVVAGVAVFDLNYRLRGEVQFTGMHIHDGAAGQNGLVTIDSGLDRDNQPNSTTGFGNLYRQATISAPRAVASMNSLAANPERHYYNFHTSVNPTGLMRAQLAQEMTALPSVAAVIAANSDPEQVTMAPLGLVTIFGSNLMKVPVGFNGFGNYAPLRLNGTSVKIAGLDAAVVTLGRVPTSVPTDYIVAQVPAGAPNGVQPVVVTNSNGAGAASSILVNTVAPAVYFDGIGGIVYKTADMRLVRPDNPARSGETLAVISTGLGQTTPALATGEYSNGSNATSPVAVTVGGLAAKVLSSTALPGMPGVYWTVFEVPAGLPSVPATLRLTSGEIRANPVRIDVR
jgi:uncharacterized protein (TIGR03437 family)